MKLTVAIIAKNEEEVIEECLKTLSFCDQIVLIDNDSIDRTKEIAKKFKADIYSTKTDDFARLRNLGLEKAKGDWILYVDADERLSEELASSIKYHVSSRDQKYSAFKVKRKNFYYGDHEWPKIEHLERLFEKKHLEAWRGELHESPVYTGETGELDGFLFHYTHRNLSQMVKKTIEWSKIEAKLRFDAHHPKMTWWRFPRVMFFGFYDSYVRQSGWKAGTVGIVESMYQAFSMFVTYARLWELQQGFKIEEK
jgi:glycosyltransferase involved in cell wall biosynthesis